MLLDKKFLYVTTLITTEWHGKGFSGTGFFFQQSDPQQSEDPMHNYWLVTNCHVLYSQKGDDDKRRLVDRLTFRVRGEETTTQKLIWLEISLSQAELLAKAKVHPDKNVDVAVIDICDKVKQELNKYDDLNVFISPIQEENLADKSKFPIEVSDDVAVIGYPQGFYDTVNLYPIVKSGIIASMWGADFRGTKGFAIDAKLFPGSSGSLVITKPRIEDLDDHDHIVFRKEKCFYCLGIYSGDPVFHRITIDENGKPVVIQYTFDLGQVWYYYLIPETIKIGSTPAFYY